MLRILGLYGNNGKQNGKDYNGLYRVHGDLLLLVSSFGCASVCTKE